MAKTLEEGAGLNLQQKQFLAVVLEEPYILANFYLSGGTALSSWYLHHRESYDLDFFTENRFDSDRITNWIKNNQDKIDYQWMGVDEGWQFYSYLFRFPNNSRLKVDFGRYASARIQKGIIWKGLTIDSLLDIAVNKAHLFTVAPRERDYIDLYFIMKHTGWQLSKLLRHARKKFEIDFNPVQVTKNLLKAGEISDVPTMLVPFHRKDMELFFLDLASSLKKDIFV